MSVSIEQTGAFIKNIVTAANAQDVIDNANAQDVTDAEDPTDPVDDANANAGASASRDGHSCWGKRRWDEESWDEY